MSAKLTYEQCCARAEAYMSCSDHLDLDWCDSNHMIERQEGNKLSGKFRNEAHKWLDRARELRINK